MPQEPETSKTPGDTDKRSNESRYEVRVPISHGELVDKITILEIKSERIMDEAKLRNIRTELAQLRTVWELTEERLDQPGSVCAQIHDVKDELKKVNEELWDIEDDIRKIDRYVFHSNDLVFWSEQARLETYLFLARSVYLTNDKRAALKKEINKLTGSALVEEKSYQEYQA